MFKYIIKLILIFFIILLPACQQKKMDSGSKEGIKSVTKPSRPFSEKHNQVKIALLLPLSGNNAKLGQAMVSMAELSLLNNHKTNIKLQIYDVGESNIIAQNRTREAIQKGAKLIIGPVFADTTEMVKDIAIRNKVNLISFSNNPDLANQGIFTIGFIFDTQIQKIVNFAINQNITQFYALLPANAYGNKVSKMLREIVVAKGGNVGKTEFYTNSDAELSIAVQSIIAAINNNADKSGEISDHYALFIPEGGNNLRMVLAALAKYNLNFNKVQLLGTGQWDDKDNLAIHELNGAWFAGNYTSERQLLEQMFYREYGYKPPRLSTLAYDALSLASILAQENNFSKEALMNRRGFIGVDGLFRFNEDGTAERNLSILKINNGMLEVLSPADASFEE